MSGVLRVTVPVVLQRNSEGFWLEFKGDNKEALISINDLGKGEIIQACVDGWAREQLTAALMSKRRVVGLKDKNDKPVHEGDIVQYTPPEGDAVTNKGVVKWQASAAAFIIQGNNFASHNLSQIPRWEVIGNIFENPELL